MMSYVVRSPNAKVIVIDGGNKLLNSPMADRLPSNYVQMAHHGQNGVNEAFSRRVGKFEASFVWQADADELSLTAVPPRLRRGAIATAGWTSRRLPQRVLGGQDRTPT